MLISMNEHHIDTPHKNVLSFSFKVTRGKVTLTNAFGKIKSSYIYVSKFKV